MSMESASVDQAQTLKPNIFLICVQNEWRMGFHVLWYKVTLIAIIVFDTGVIGVIFRDNKFSKYSKWKVNHYIKKYIEIDF